MNYKELEEYILNNVEYTYNVAKCLKDFINDMQENGGEEGVFFMTEDQEHFRITRSIKIINEENKEFEETFNVEKL